jgi:hypothetical protein
MKIKYYMGGGATYYLSIPLSQKPLEMEVIS